MMPTWTVQDSIQVREQWKQFEDMQTAQLFYTLGTMPQDLLATKLASNSSAYEYVATCLCLVACQVVQNMEAKKAESN